MFSLGLSFTGLENGLKKSKVLGFLKTSKILGFRKPEKPQKSIISVFVVLFLVRFYTDHV